MNFDKIQWLIKNDITVKLIRADNAPLIISFLHLSFKQQNKITFYEKELTSLLSDYLYSLNQNDSQNFQSSAKEYLDNWAKIGFLRRYYEGDSNEAQFDLTPATENALEWIGELDKSEFVGTESRLLHFFSILKELVSKANPDVDTRIKELKDQKVQLELEIARAEQGQIETLDETKIKERYLYAEETAKRLLSDFRQVEQNFRDLDKDVREKIIKSNLRKGKLLDDIFAQQDYLWTTDQGKSFRAFWEFLMSPTKQQDLEELTQSVLNLSEVQTLKSDFAFDRIKNNLINAGEKVEKTNDSLIEQLRKYLEQKSFQESKKILQSIEKIEKFVLEHKDTISNTGTFMEIDGTIRLNIVMERPLFRPPYKVKFQNLKYEVGLTNSDDSKLYNQFFIDEERLKENIKDLLRTQSTVTLKEVTEKHKINRGIAEVVAYIHIATKGKKHFVNEEITEELLVENYKSGKIFIIELPQVTFNN